MQSDQSKNLKVMVAVLTFNEGEKLRSLLDQFPEDRQYKLLFVDDGSTDGSGDMLKGLGYNVIRHEHNKGVGAGIRTAVEYQKNDRVDVLVIMAGNGKMLPAEIPRLLKPLYEDRADYVQGSRYLKGGRSPHLPLFRKIAIRLFTLITNAALGFHGTDVTCGFRAWRLKILDDPAIDINQEWLGRYEMEYYLHYKVCRSGYRVVEVPVSMVYPKSGQNYSKIKPFVGWWSMIRPWIFLVLRLKK